MFQVIYAVTVATFGIEHAPAIAVALLIQTVQVIPVVAIGTSLTPGIMPRSASEPQSG